MSCIRVNGVSVSATPPPSLCDFSERVESQRYIYVFNTSLCYDVMSLFVFWPKKLVQITFVFHFIQNQKMFHLIFTASWDKIKQPNLTFERLELVSFFWHRCLKVMTLSKLKYARISQYVNEKMLKSCIRKIMHSVPWQMTKTIVYLNSCRLLLIYLTCQLWFK